MEKIKCPRIILIHYSVLILIHQSKLEKLNVPTSLTGVIRLTHFLVPQAKKNRPDSKSSLDPNDPFNDDERERLEVKALARKFESKYVSVVL